jgi:hypothetical protein
VVVLAYSRLNVAEKEARETLGRVLDKAATGIVNLLLARLGLK